MADNVIVSEGVGKTIATDDVGGVQYQIMKIDAGGDGVSVPIIAGQQLAAASMPVVLASDKDVPVKPFSAILEGGLTELVGINEEVNTDDYSGSVEVALGGSYSGEIQQFTFYATEDGTGAVQDSAGILYIFDADPTISSGDTSMSAAERVTIIGKVYVNADDWDVDTNGGTAFIYNQPVAFHSLASLFFAWKHLDAVDLNDGAGDDEQLEFNFWYKRES